MEWIQKSIGLLARPIPIGLLVAAVLTFRHFMQGILRELKKVSGESLLDYEVFYSARRVHEVFGSYGPDGIQLYQQFMQFDLVFPLLYGLLFAALLFVILESTKWRLLVYAPLAMSAFDYIENVSFLLLLNAWPDIPAIPLYCANVMTLAKFGSGAASVFAGVVALFIATRRVLDRNT